MIQSQYFFFVWFLLVCWFIYSLIIFLLFPWMNGILFRRNLVFYLKNIDLVCQPSVFEYSYDLYANTFESLVARWLSWGMQRINTFWFSCSYLWCKYQYLSPFVYPFESFFSHLKSVFPPFRYITCGCLQIFGEHHIVWPIISIIQCDAGGRMLCFRCFCWESSIAELVWLSCFSFHWKIHTFS